MDTTDVTTLLMGNQKSGGQKTPGMYRTLLNGGMNYQPQLVQDFFQKHC